ncbi:MAG TPA: anthranilate synthase component I family protein [Flavisolibacter sp.]
MLDTQESRSAIDTYEYLIGAGCLSSIDGASSSFHKVDRFVNGGQWSFGHLGYDLFSPLQTREGAREDQVGFSPFFFFHPIFVLYINNGRLHIEGPHPDQVWDEIMGSSESLANNSVPLTIRQRLSKEKYLAKIAALREHIRRGDCYEINFCQEFFAERIDLAHAGVFEALCALSPHPFSAYYKVNDRVLVCASPERYLKKEGQELISQPMKGTARRTKSSSHSDEEEAHQLHISSKDRSENVMVVDLVRNDLSMVCEPGSVTTEDLFRVYTFPAVHQMVSTVKGRVRTEVTFSKIVEATFPMGSMTGAPKKRVMELIGQYEEGSRGIFSGAVGYLAPGGDFDFNVVIRSIMYNASNKYLSYQVGSGITFYSDPEGEWEECLLKGESIKKVLTSASTRS